MARYSIEQFIKPFEDKPIASPDKTLGQVLEYTKSSHKPIYVFDNKHYKGVISAYHAIYHNYHAPYTKKVISELLQTPNLTKESSLFDVLRAMLDTRLYELPILDDKGDIAGIVHVVDIMRQLIHDPMISTYLVECIEIPPVTTHPSEGTVKDIFKLLRTKGISRIVLTDSHDKVRGIVTRSDIKTAFLRPIHRPRYRGITETEKNHIFDDEEIYRIDDPISRYAQTNVFTISDDKSTREILNTLIQSDQRSLVIVDALNHPTSIVSLKNILHCLATFEPDVDIPIVFEKPNGTVTDRQIEKAQEKIEIMVKKLSKIRDIMKVEIAIDEQKYANQKVAVFKTSMQLDIPGNNVIVTAEGRDYIDSINDAIALAEKQFIKYTKRTYHKSPPSLSA